MAQLEDILGSKSAKIFNKYYGVQRDGNVDPAQDPQNELMMQVIRQKSIMLCLRF